MRGRTNDSERHPHRYRPVAETPARAPVGRRDRRIRGEGRGVLPPDPANQVFNGFRRRSRDWGYILERHGLRKGEFDDAEQLITACRKSGALPLDICAEDESRKAVGLQDSLDNPDIEAEAESWIDYISNQVHKSYTPISFWDDLDVYVEVAVEKLDLRNLFEAPCAEFYVPIQNFKGWSDLNGRAAMMRRFAEHEAAGRRCVLLLCGDHDPGGLHQTDKMRKNLEDLSGAVGWTPENLIVRRFGLNADFIDRHGLTWIDNLETSSGQQLNDPNHEDHDKRYVQDYIARFGVRKCEANALVVVPEIGRQLCRDAILAIHPGRSAGALSPQARPRADEAAAGDPPADGGTVMSPRQTLPQQLKSTKPRKKMELKGGKP